jgi:hypothetical protein
VISCGDQREGGAARSWFRSRASKTSVAAAVRGSRAGSPPHKATTIGSLSSGASVTSVNCKLALQGHEENAVQVLH